MRKFYGGELEFKLKICLEWEWKRAAFGTGMGGNGTQKPIPAHLHFGNRARTEMYIFTRFFMV